jgi:hypothetical protein
LTGSASGSQEHLVKLAVVDEDICQWIEKAIAHGRDVEISVSEDVLELWQPSDKFITGIKFKEETGATRKLSENPRLEVQPLTDENYEALKKRLLKDPEFLRELMKKSNIQNAQ